MPNILDSENQHIYITSDSEIKEGDWFIYRCYKVCKCTGLSQSKQILTNKEIAKHKDYGKPQGLSKKIILTTDQDLIKDGVQSIDDEFLEWFVKNSNCEEVEFANSLVRISSFDWRTDYKIIIPKEELSKDEIDKFFVDMVCNSKEEPKQETIEEAIDRIFLYQPGDMSKGIAKKKAIELAKWQAESMYSEEEVLVKLYECLGHFAYQHNILINGNEIDKWFEQFKKK
jgi:hypothetical protein